MFKPFLKSFANQATESSDNARLSDLKVGDVVVVYGYQAKVDAIWHDASTSRTQIDICYGVHGKAKIFAHDEFKVWHRLASMN